PVRVPWGKLIRSRNLWAICVMYVVTNYCWYFLMYFLPRAMQAEFKSWTETTGGKILLALLAGSPLLIGMFGCLLGGTLSDRYIRRTGDRKWGRRVPGMIGYGGGGICYLATAAVEVVFAGQPLSVRLLSDPHGLFERPHHGPGMGGLPGHWQRLCGHGFRNDEYVRQPSGCGFYSVGERKSARKLPWHSRLYYLLRSL